MVDKDRNIELVGLLNECTPGYLSKEVFDAVARVSVYPAIEMIPYRFIEGIITVGLLQRPPDDTFWPNQWHIPGTVLRPIDQKLEDAFDRLFANEFKKPKGATPELFSVNIVPYKRGNGLTLEHMLNFSNIQENGDLSFFSIDELPSNFIEEQKPIIDRFKMAVLKITS